MAQRELERSSRRFATTTAVFTALLGIRVEKDGTHLYAQAEGQPAFPLLYQGSHRFEAPARTGIEIVFEVSGNEADGFQLHQNGRVQQARRIRE